MVSDLEYLAHKYNMVNSLNTKVRYYHMIKRLILTDLYTKFN